MTKDQFHKAVKVVTSCENMDQLKVAMEYIRIHDKEIMKNTAPGSMERRAQCIYLGELNRLVLDKMWREFQP